MKSPSVRPANTTMKITRKPRPSILATSAVALLGLSFFSGSAEAQQIWDANGIVLGGSGNGNWDLATPNWTTDPTGILPPTTWNQGTDAFFNFAGGGTVTVVAGVQVNDIAFNSNGYTLTGGALALTGGSTFIDSAAGITGTISVPLTGSNAVRINGFAGTGTAVFAGSSANTYAGATFIDKGTLQLNNGGASVAVPGNITIGDSVGAAGSAIVQLLQSNQIGNSSALVINSDGLFNLNGFAENVGSVAGNAGSQIVLGVGGSVDTGGANTNTTFAGVISGDGPIAKNGTGTWTLTGANSYTGITTVQGGGILEAGNNTALGTAASGTGVIAGNSLRLLNGVNTGAEALTLNGAGFNAATGALAVAAGGSATVGGPINISTSSTITANGGTLTLTGGIVKNGTTLTFGTATSGGGTINMNSVISGAVANSDLIVESMTVNLNAANTYNGPTFIRSSGGAGTGILNANVAGALPDPAFGAPARSALTMDDTTSLGSSVLNLNGGVGQVVASLTSPNSVIGQSSRINLNGNTLKVGTAAGTTTFFGLIGPNNDLGGLIKDGASTQILAGSTQGYIGATVVQAGHLQIGDGLGGNLNGASAVTVNPLAFLDLNLATGATFQNAVLNNGTVQGINTVGNTQTVSGVITGIGNFLQNAGGTTVFTNVNTFQGGSLITGAGSTLRIGTAGSGASAGSGLIEVNNGGTLSLVNAAGNTLSNNIIANSGAGSVVSTTAGSITLSGNILDGGGANILSLTQNGTGNLILTGSSDYKGVTTVNSGEIQAGSDTALGFGAGFGGTTVNTGGTLRILNGVTIANEVLTITGSGTANKGALAGSLGGVAAYGGAITLAGNASINSAGGTLILSGGIDKNGTTLTLTGGGLGGTININNIGISGAAANSDLVVDGLTVNLNVANTYNGPTFITNGATLNANVAGALPTAVRSAVTFDPTIAIPASPATFPSSGNSKLVLGAAQSVASLAGANTTSSINLNTFTLTVGAAAGTTSFSGVISGAGGITKDTAGSTQILAGINTYTGATSVTDGTLQAGSGQAFGLNSAVTLGAAGTLDLGGFSNSIGSLSGVAGAIVQNSTVTAATLTTGGDNTSTTFAGVIQNGAGGLLSLTKNGVGTQTLIGANTYTGATTVNGGILQVGNGTTGNLAAASPVTVNNGGILGINLVNGGIFGNAVTNNAGGLVSGNNGAGSTQTLSGIISGAGALNQNGLGTTILTGANTYTGDTTVIFGTLQVGDGSSGSINPSSAVTVDGGANLNIFLANGGVFGNAVVNNGAVNGLAAAATTNTVAGNVSGLGTLNQIGLGTTILTGANTYLGATNVNAGTLQIGNGASGSINAASPINILGGATLAVNMATGGNLANTIANAGTINAIQAGVNTLSGVISGVGVLNQNGTGTTNVSGANTYTGLTTLNAGVLEVQNNTALGAVVAGTVVNNGAALRLASGIIVGAEALTINGAGTGAANALGALTQVAGGSSTYGGAITVATNSTIHANGGVLTLTGTIDKTDTTLTLAGGGTINVNNAITGDNDNLFNDDLVVNGTTVNLNFANTYEGPTTIRSVVAGDGILNANVANALPTVNGRSAVTMDDAGAGGSILNLVASQSIASLVGGGSSLVNLNGNTLTVGFGSGVNTNGVAGANFAGVVSGTGGIVKDDNSTQILSGTNTYTGTTVVNGGTLQAGSNQAFGVNSPVTVTVVAPGTSAILELAGFSNTIDSLSGGGANSFVQNNLGGAATLNLSGAAGAFSFYSGIIRDLPASPLSLVLNDINGFGAAQSLSGQSTYTGGTTLNGGTLNIDASSTALGTVPPVSGPLGTGSLTINGGTIGTTSTTNGTVDQNIGNAVFVNNSFNVTSSDGVNFVGGPVVADGVTFNGPVRLNASVTITTNSGYLDLTGVVSQLFGGTNLTFAGNTFTLLGAGGLGDAPNTYNGLTTVQSGLLLLNKGPAVAGASGIAIAGNLQVDAGALVQVNSNFLSGGGTANNQIVPSANALVNGTLDIGGTNQALNSLNGSGFVQLSDAAVNTVFAGVGGTTAGTLTLNNGFFSGVIADAGLGGNLTKVSAGTLTLTGASTYVGNTNINAGTLIVDGSLRSANLFINGAGTLAGFGRTFGNVTNSGVFTPGRSVGTFTIGGNYTQTSGGTLIIEIGGRNPGESDLVAVGGKASLNGNLRLINRLKGTTLKVGDRITILTAAGGVNGEFSDVSNPFSPTGTIVENNVLYLSNSVVLATQRGSFADFADAEGLTPNQKSVAKALDNLNGSNKQAKLFAFLDNQLLGELPHDFDLIAPEEFQAIYTIGISQANVQSANLSRRMDDLRSGSTGFSAAGLSVSGLQPQYSGSFLTPQGGLTGPEGKMSKEIRPPEEDNRVGVFVTGSGEWTNIGGTYNATGYNLAAGGFTLGVDYKLTEHFAVGVNAGYSKTSADFAGNSSINVDGAKFGAYATYFNSGFYGDVSVQGGHSYYDTIRQALGGRARGNTNGSEINVLAAVGYDYKSGGLTVGPIASFQYTNVGFKSFRENNSLAPLKLNSQSAESMRTALGAKASYEFQLGTVIIKPELRLAWQHEFGDSAYGIGSQFAGTNSTFNVEGAEIGSDSLLVGAGFAILWNERTSTYVYYDGELGRSNFESNNVSGGVRMEF